MPVSKLKYFILGIITDSYKLNLISLITYLHVLLQSTHFVSKSVAMEFSQNLKVFSRDSALMKHSNGVIFLKIVV